MAVLIRDTKCSKDLHSKQKRKRQHQTIRKRRETQEGGVNTVKTEIIGHGARTSRIAPLDLD